MNTLKFILNKIKNFLVILILLLIGLIKKLFKIEKNNITQKTTIKEETKTINNKKIENINTSPANHDEDNIKSNNHDNTIQESSESAANDIVLELPKEQVEKIKNISKKEEPTIEEILDILIDEELEEIYKEDNFKIKNTTKEVEKKIKELKERIIPKITIRIEKKFLLDEKQIKKEIKERVEEDLIEKPLFKENNIYSLVIPKKKELKINNETKKVNSKEKIITTEHKETIKKKLDETNITMSKNIEEIPKPTIEEKISEAAIIGTLATTGIVKEILASKKDEKQKTAPDIKENKKIEETPEIINENNEVIELPKLSEEKNINTKNMEIKVEQINKDTEKITQVIEDSKNENKQENSEPNKNKDNDLKQINKNEQSKIEIELIKESEIENITKKTTNLIDESNEEIKKEEFEERDYDKIEDQINRMLNDISNTYLRYEKKMTEKQKQKLKKEVEKLRNTKDIIKLQKEKDIQIEIDKLTENIKESELSGLQKELKNIEFENNLEVNEDFFKKMNKLEGITKEQVANADKKMMLRRFKKASLLLEMTSLLSLPFVRNKYFFYFTVGLIIDNHFNFVNAFFNRKINKYEPADLSQIKKGQDALNGALDITYKNIIELDYLEQQALARYPELAYDTRFINQVTHLRTQLNKKYNKLMKKNKVMEKYYTKTKKHIKVLKHKKEYN